LPLFCFFLRVRGRGSASSGLSVAADPGAGPLVARQRHAGDLHVHHMVFGVVFMFVGGVTGIVAPAAR